MPAANLCRVAVELIRFWVYLATTVSMSTLLRFWVLKFVGVSEPKPMHEFLPNFPDMLTPGRSIAD